MARRLTRIALAIYHKLSLPESVRYSINKAFNRVAFDRAQQVRHAAGIIDLEDYSVKERPSLYNFPEFENIWPDLLASIRLQIGASWPISHVITLPFFGIGGAQKSALETARAIVQQTGQGVILLGVDKTLGAFPPSKPGIAIVDLCTLSSQSTTGHRQELILALLKHFGIARVHNVNSEVVWDLYLRSSDRILPFATLFASIFAYQFDEEGREITGYAQKFLQPGLDVCDTIFTDNQRFIEMATERLEGTGSPFHKLHCAYNPVPTPPSQSVTSHKGGFVWAGRLDKDKRFGLLLDIATARPDLKFHVFGSKVVSDVQNDPMTNAPPNVIYEGPFSPETLSGFSIYDALLFTSNWEGLPNLLLEAGSAGVPIIAPLVGGVGELITYKTGFPLPEGATTENYIDAIELVLSAPSQAEKKSHALKTLIGRRHSYSTFTDSLAAAPGYLGRSNA